VKRAMTPGEVTPSFVKGTARVKGTILLTHLWVRRAMTPSKVTPSFVKGTARVKGTILLIHLCVRGAMTPGEIIPSFQFRRFHGGEACNDAG
jgi:hypothetical protein